MTALTRPSSLENPEVTRLANDGVKIVAADLAGAEEDLVKMLEGLDVVLLTIYGGSVTAETALINASKATGIQRYFLCFFATIAPPEGTLLLRGIISWAAGLITRQKRVNITMQKGNLLKCIKKMKLLYTVVDVK